MTLRLSDRAATLRWPRARHDGQRHRAEDIARRALAIAADICVYTNGNLTVESIMTDLTPREIVSELDRFNYRAKRRETRCGRGPAQSVAAQTVRDDLRDEVYPKNILMIGPTGVGKTEISRRLGQTGARALSSRSRPRNSPRSAMSGATWNRSSAIWSTAAIEWNPRTHARRREDQRSHAAEDRVIDAIAGTTPVKQPARCSARS